MEIGSSEGNGGGVFNFDMEVGRRGKYAVVRGCINERIPNYLPNLDASRLMDEQHPECSALRRDTVLSADGAPIEGGCWRSGTFIWYLSKLVGARRE